MDTHAGGARSWPWSGAAAALTSACRARPEPIKTPFVADTRGQRSAYLLYRWPLGAFLQRHARHPTTEDRQASTRAARSPQDGPSGALFEVVGKDG